MVAGSAGNFVFALMVKMGKGDRRFLTRALKRKMIYLAVTRGAGIRRGGFRVFLNLLLVAATTSLMHGVLELNANLIGFLSLVAFRTFLDWFSFSIFVMALGAVDSVFFGVVQVSQFNRRSAPDTVIDARLDIHGFRGFLSFFGHDRPGKSKKAGYK